MSALCTICNQRRAKRACPAANSAICALCCAEAREVRLDCPRDCSYLQDARQHEGLVKLTADDVPHRDIAVTEDFVRQQEWPVLWLGNALSRAMEQHHAIDADARAALEAAIRKQRNLDLEPLNEVGTALLAAMETAIAQWRSKAPEDGGPGPLKDSELLGVLIFIQRLGLQYNNGRIRGRRFYDFMLDHFPSQPAEGASA